MRRVEGFDVLIEQAMYFALGFLVAGLLTLMFLPAFWRRALRLSMRRLQMLMPLSMEEVVAERDLLRAEFAVRERRLEQEMDAIKSEKTLDLATIGRHATRIADLEARLKKAEAETRDMAQQVRESQKVLAERTDLLSSTELALHEMTERAERGVERLRLLESDKEALGRQTEEHQTRVVAHEAKIGALHEETVQFQRDLEALREEHAAVVAQANRLPGLEGDLARVSSELENSLSEKKTLSSALLETRTELSSLQEKRKNEVDYLESALRTARAEARDNADKHEAARADNAMLQGAVEALRSERAQHRRGAGAFSVVGAAPTAADVPALREAVIGFGDKVAQLSDPDTGKQRVL